MFLASICFSFLFSFHRKIHLSQEKDLKSLWKIRLIAKAETFFFFSSSLSSDLIPSRYTFSAYKSTSIWTALFLILFLIISILFIGSCINYLLLHNKLPADKYLFSHSDPSVSERETMRVEAVVFF